MVIVKHGHKFGKMQMKISGDVAAQQAIRFNIFHLYQTYTGNNAKLISDQKDLLVKNMVAQPIGILRLIAFPFI